MESSAQARALSRLPLRSFRMLFSGLESLVPGSTKGFFRGEIVGPAWLRLAAPAGLFVTGLGGWWGKELDGKGWGTNIVERRDGCRRVVPVTVSSAPSFVDGKPCLMVSYPAASPIPWRWAVDELRRYDGSTLLGLTLLRHRLMGCSALPFLLHATEAPAGL